MSIHNLYNKIKGPIKNNHILLINIFIIILVGFSSFGLGRLSVNNNIESKNSDVVIDSSDISSNNNISLNNSTNNSYTGKYVASKNGKLYYSINCSGANRIKDSNKIWFDNVLDAEKLGFSLSPTCK